MVVEDLCRVIRTSWVNGFENCQNNSVSFAVHRGDDIEVPRSIFLDSGEGSKSKAYFLKGSLSRRSFQSPRFQHCLAPSRCCRKTGRGNPTVPYAKVCIYMPAPLV